MGVVDPDARLDLRIRGRELIGWPERAPSSTALAGGGRLLARRPEHAAVVQGRACLELVRAARQVPGPRDGASIQRIRVLPSCGTVTRPPMMMTR